MSMESHSLYICLQKGTNANGRAQRRVKVNSPILNAREDMNKIWELVPRHYQEHYYVPDVDERLIFLVTLLLKIVLGRQKNTVICQKK